MIPTLSEIPPFRRRIDRAGLGVIGRADATADLARQLVAAHDVDAAAYEQRRQPVMALAHEYAWPRITDRYLKVYEAAGERP